MAFSSEAFASAPFSAESGTGAAHSATGIVPLFKFGPHVGRIDILASASAISPLFKYGSNAGLIHWVPRPLIARPRPLLPLLKFGSHEQAETYYAQSVGPLVKVPKGYGRVNRGLTVSATSVAHLFKFGVPLGVETFDRRASPVAPILKFGSPAGQYETISQAVSVGPLLNLGQPEGTPAKRYQNVFVLTRPNKTTVTRKRA